MSVREILERALCESIFDCPPEDANADEISTISKAASGVLAALDAEGVGLPWVSVEDRLPAVTDADDNDCVLWATESDWWESYYHEGAENDATHWCRTSAIPLPGQSPEPSAGLREAVRDVLDGTPLDRHGNRNDDGMRMHLTMKWDGGTAPVREWFERLDSALRAEART